MNTMNEKKKWGDYDDDSDHEIHKTNDKQSMKQEQVQQFTKKEPMERHKKSETVLVKHDSSKIKQFKQKRYKRR